MGKVKHLAISAVALLLVVSSYASVPVKGQSDSRYFPETNYAIGGRFLAYWDAHGGLSQFGYPISNAFQEVSELDGKSYTVQYFERAEFEYHPENQPPYDVLLAQLGRFRYQQKYAADLTPPPVSHEIGYSIYPPAFVVGSGDYLFWTYGSGGVYSLHGYRISAEKEFTFTTDSQLYNLATNGKVVFGVATSDSYTPMPTPAPTVQPNNLSTLPTGDITTYTTTIVSYDPVTQNKQTLLVIPNANIADLAFDAGTLYYGYTYSNAIYAYDLATGQQQQVIVAHGQLGDRNGSPGLVAKDGYLLWSEYDNNLSNLHLLKVGAGAQDTVIATTGSSGFSSYDLSGDHVVWSLAEQGIYIFDSGVHLYQISTGATRLLSDYGLTPLIKGSKVVWVKDEPIAGCTYSYVCDNYSLTEYDLSSNTSRVLVAPDNYYKGAVQVVGNILVYIKAAGYKLQGSLLYTVPLN